MPATASSNVNQRIVEKRHCWIEALRIFIGALFLYKGYYFVENLSLVYDYIDETMPVNAFLVSHYVVFAHLAGGLMIIFGMLTRIAVLAQMPIVILGAIYYTGKGSTFFGPTAELEYSLLILVLLIVFFFYGAGKCSVDHYILRTRQANEEESRRIKQDAKVDRKSEEEKTEK